MSACWSEEVLSRFPVRKTRAQKEAFRAFASERFASRGWRVAEETGGIARSVNLIVGDVARAKIVFAAHYDTCAALPMPNFIAPSNWAATLLYQVALGVCLCVPAALVSAAVALLLRLPLVAGLAGCLCCAALVALMLCGEPFQRQRQHLRRVRAGGNHPVAFAGYARGVRVFRP